jgi:hypothetical protein
MMVEALSEKIVLEAGGFCLIPAECAEIGGNVQDAASWLEIH